MDKDNPIDLEQEVEFYDPHNGRAFHGAAAAPPQPVMKAVGDLVGKKMKLRLALERIRSAAFNHGRVEAHNGCILLCTHSEDELTDRNRITTAHCWRLVRYR